MTLGWHLRAQGRLPARLRAALAAAIAVPTAIAVPAQADGPWVAEKIAATGDPVPGVPGMVFGNVIVGYSIDNSGGVAFRGVWFDPSTFPPSKPGIFYGHPEQVEPVQLFSHPAGLPNSSLLFQEFPQPPRVSLSGTTTTRAWTGTFYPGFTTAAYAGRPAGPALVAYEGGPAPGIPGATVTEIYDVPLVNNSGQVAYSGTVSDPSAPPGGLNQVLMAGPPNQLGVVARSGFPVDPIPGATYIGVGNATESNLNDNGQVGFLAVFSDPSFPGVNQHGYFRWTQGATQVVFRTGMQAPTMPPGVTFSGFGGYQPGFSNSGRAVFKAFVQGPGIDGASGAGIWAGGPDDLRSFIQTGQTTPGLDRGEYVADVQFANISNIDTVIARGNVAGPGVTAANDQAVWLGPIDAPQVIFREGGQAPGLPDGTVFAFSDDPTTGLASPYFALNDPGDVLLRAPVAGPDVTPENNLGLWFRDADTQAWSLLLRTGDLIDGHVITPAGQPGSGGSIVFNYTSGGGRSNSLLNDGSFVVTLGFVGGSSGVYRFTVPEPSTILPLVVALAAMRRRAHRRRE